MTDIRLENHGSLFLMRGTSPAGRQWIEDYVAVEQHSGGAAVIEWRYASDIVNGAGMTVSRSR